jgi:hypothetical protein
MADSVSMIGSTRAQYANSSTLVLKTNLGGKNYNIVNDAANEWNSALGREAVKIERGNVSSNPRTADGVNSLTTGNLPGNALGVTYSHVETQSGKPTIKEEDIVIEPINNEEEFKAVALHEIGHALGAEHVKNEDAVMNATLETGDNSKIPTKLTQADINAVKNVGVYVDGYA